MPLRILSMFALLCTKEMVEQVRADKNSNCSEDIFENRSQEKHIFVPLCEV